MCTYHCPQCGAAQYADNPLGDKSTLPEGYKFQIELPDNYFQCAHCGYTAHFDVWEAYAYEEGHRWLRTQLNFDQA